MSEGGFDDHFVPNGEYLCAACMTPLYKSEMKFDCGCGWPGFWTNIKDAVTEQPDHDGRRVEIICSACRSHLGHLFRGEGFRNPEPNERHCVNSVSLAFRDRNGQVTKCTYDGIVH
jgi:peptide-methionine (R)-S-oxide reductase